LHQKNFQRGTVLFPFTTALSKKRAGAFARAAGAAPKNFNKNTAAVKAAACRTRYE